MIILEHHVFPRAPARDFDNHLLSRNCSQSKNQPGCVGFEALAMVTKAREAQAARGRKRGYLRRAFSWYCGRWSIVVICCAEETIFQHQKGPAPRACVYLPARLTVI